MKYLLIILLFLFPVIINAQVITDTVVYVQQNGDTTKVVNYRNAATTTTVSTTKLRDTLTAIISGVTTALGLKQNSLGFTPYNATNPNNYISSITSLNVTTALGFTPYNATNPNGYISAVPAQTFASITSKPTTLLGYGITDAAALGHTHTLASLNIGNVDNTSDASKPVSSATQTALNLKQNSLGYTPLNPANNLSDVTAATARTNLGLAIGTNVLAPNGSAASLTNFPTLNQNTSGTAAGLSAILSFANGGISASAATSATTGTITVNMVTSIITCTPSGNMTLNASGGVAGQVLAFSFTTSGVSSFTITFGTNFRKTATLATGTTSARFFTVTFICLDGTTWSEVSRTAVQT